MEERKIVQITTYINPHIFWILLKTDQNKFTTFEKLLQKHKETFQVLQTIKKIVVVKENKNWKRAVVKNFDKETKEYECWLVDYGKPLKTTEIFELPTKFATQPPFAQAACLKNVIPLKNILDIEKNKCIYEKQIEFSPGTIRIVKDLIQKADLIEFQVQNVFSNVLCGSLYLTVNKENINLIDMLIEKRHVVLDEEMFLQAMQVNHPIIENRSISAKGEILFPFCEGVGRGCLRPGKKSGAPPGEHKVPYVSKWLLQNTQIMQDSLLRKPSKIDTNFQKFSEECSTSISTKSNCIEKSSRTLDATLQDDSQLKYNDMQTIGMHAGKKEYDNICQGIAVRDQSVDGGVKSKDSTNYRLPPSMIKEYLLHGSKINHQEVNTTQQVPKSNNDSTTINYGNSTEITNCLSLGKSVQTITFGQGVNNQLLEDKLGSVHSNKIDVRNINSPSKHFEIKNIIKSRGKSTVIIPSVEKDELTKEDEDSWDDIDDDSYTPNATDSYCNKSSEDSSSDYSSNIKRKTGCPFEAKSTEENNISKLSFLDAATGKTSSVAPSSISESDMPTDSIRIKLKLGCQCETCLKWETNDFAEKEETFIDSVVKSKRIPCRPPPLFRSELEIACDIVMKKMERTQTKIQKDIAPCLLVHSLQLPHYASEVADVAFCQSVHRALNFLQLKRAHTIQTYAWPAILRSMNVCLIGAPRSGKSLCYLPAICTFLIEKESRYNELPNENSPLVIVLCESMFKVEDTYNLFISILKQTREKIGIAVAIPPLRHGDLKSIKTCDILIATPPMVINLLKSRIINLKRLCHWVLEDVDKLFIKYGNEFDSISKGIQSMLSHRVCFYGVQIITVSEQWTRNLENFLKKLDNVPIICITNYLQCAIYARANIQMHFVSSVVKVRNICDIVKDDSRTSKTIIICNNDSEVLQVSHLLQIEGVSVTGVTSDMMAEEISEQEQVWHSTTSGRYSVLICNDTMLNTQLSITQAEVLIHYSLPQEHWTDFSRRFKCLLDNYDCPLNSKFQSGYSCKVHVYVSEDCSKQYPRLCRFLTDMGTVLPQKFVNFSTVIEQNQELQKIQNNISLCKRLKLLGKCNKFRCSKRHQLDNKLDLPHWVPRSGSIKFKLLNVLDATNFSVRLLERMDTNLNISKIVDYTEFVTFELSNDIKNNRIFATNVCKGELYAWCNEEEDVFHRCKVLKILSEFKITKTAHEVLIKLIDLGKEKRVQSGTLYKLPNGYSDLPGQNIEVYLAKVLPPDDDEHWCMRTKNKVLNIINNVDKTQDDCYFTGRIVFQIGDTIWLDDIKLQKDLKHSNEIVTIFSFKKKMRELQLCTEKEQQLESLYKLCESCNIKLPNYEFNNISNIRKNVEQVQPQWGFLEDDYNAVHFSSADSPNKFYIRQQKFDKLFRNLQREIQQIIKKPFYPIVKEVYRNNCYLAQDPEGEEYGRVIVTNIHDDMVDCFFVDFGDSTRVLKSDLKFLPNDIIRRLPFQAIECSLFGVKPVLDRWAYEATDIFYDHCFEANTDVYKKLYVKHFEAVPSDTLGRNIYSIIVLDYIMEKPICINRVLIDYGFGAAIKDEILDDIVFPSIKDDDTSNIENEQEPVDDQPDEVENQPICSDAPEEGENIWDIVVNDMDMFAEDICDKMLGSERLLDNRTSIIPPDSMKPMTALPSVSYSTPDVIWYQTHNLIKFDILLLGVENYSVTILRRSIFCFSTLKNGTEYKLNFQLFDTVNSTFQHIGGGPFVRVTLTKAKPISWDRLTFSSQKMRNIKYNVSKCVFPDDEKRLFLDIGQDEADEVDNNEVIIEIGSDTDYSESDIETDFDSD